MDSLAAVTEYVLARRQIPTVVRCMHDFLSYKISLIRCTVSLRRDRGIMVPEPPEKNHDYRREARNIRALAWDMHDVESCAQLLLIASLYDQLAHLSNIRVPALETKLSDDSRRKDRPSR
jgi:hypothetical protein